MAAVVAADIETVAVGTAVVAAVADLAAVQAVAGLALSAVDRLVAVAVAYEQDHFQDWRWEDGGSEHLGQQS